MTTENSNQRIRVRTINDNLFWVGEDNRGYRFFGYQEGRKFRVKAGCHTFTMSEARRHWSEPKYITQNTFSNCNCFDCKSERTDAKRRLPKIIRMLAAIETEAIKRKWLRPRKKAGSK